MKATLYTIIALMAFAANSLLCRMALAGGYIDPWNFTIIRLLSGAVCLGIIMTVYTYNIRRKSAKNDDMLNNAILKDKGSWLSSVSLVVYALCFSIAYVELDTGTGALILFSAVQLTMIGWGIYQKEQLSTLQWGALLVALAGFIYLMLPSAAVPSLLGAMIMAISGAAWGIYSIRGKVCVSPLRTTGFNFIRSLVAIPILLLAGMSYLVEVSIEGVLLACLSGAVASGIGYSLWYVAMPLLKSTQAAVVQFCVPVLAAIAGMLFLSEPLTMRFIVASAVILGAVSIFVLNKKTVKA
ncbi:DMT family transporter [Psychrobacter sp. LV10R520-6]|uniref:DMT family transporter n=1 Tax=Psychrobacter sp. LV10R520-6 TaxID=1415574 RepID=UPI0024CD08A6|nr:DMT family transporter [Psychrobacter sp. LV10R520-6]SNT69766.1 EamA-like transporter family protein [Psychrobacter sp. LV10R520-6]